MENSAAERHAYRLGVLLTELAAMLTAFMVGGGGLVLDVIGLVVLAQGGLGISLMTRSNRLVRGIAGFAVGAIGALAAGASLVHIAGAARTASVLDLGNALASTVLFAWLCAMAVLGLSAPHKQTAALTARIGGGCAVLIAASHLYLARLVGFGLSGGLFGGGPFGGVSINLRLEGTQVSGFPGWQLWHLAMACVGLAMLAAPRAALRQACWALFGLFAILAPLTLVSLLGAGFHLGSVTMLVIWSCLLFPLQGSYWLADNLRREHPSSIAS
ncbi:MAG TPA: hypothetical protein VGC42_00325 [Kofleriaceae bacterium]